jgi:hypothetical protein
MRYKYLGIYNNEETAMGFGNTWVEAKDNVLACISEFRRLYPKRNHDSWAIEKATHMFSIRRKREKKQ